MNPPSSCLECGAALTAADAGGLCPRCLLRLGLASQLASGALPATAIGLGPDGAVLEPFDFGNYRILRLLGKGGMGAVYEAEQRPTGRRVALKVLGHTLDTPELRQRFLREGQLAAAIRHPNSVAVFSAEEIEGAPAIAMELVPDGTLKDRVKQGGPLPLAEAVDAILQIIDGLEAAQAGGVLHRDIKPANCFAGPDGTVKVGDFGLSISTLVKAEQQLTQPGAVLGTPAFASPEQLRAQEIDVRSDIYSVGATLYFLLTGQPTHDASTLVALIAAVLERDPIDPQKLRPETPSTLARVVMRCLARQASARFANYGELRAALLPFRSIAPVPAPLTRRVLAGLIDPLVVAIPWMVSVGAIGPDPEANLLIHRNAAAFGVLLALLLWEIGVLILPEARWGAGLGKTLCGLRVVRLNGDVPGLSRALGRWAVIAFVTYFHLILVWFTRTADEYREAWQHQTILWEDVVTLPLFSLLYVTMRRRNGYATLYDLLTGTRVVLAPASAKSSVVEVPAWPPVAPAGEKIGPFVVGPAVGGELVLGFDEALRRHVWIQQQPVGSAPLPATRRDLGRPGRLRWLTGTRSEKENWDAFEAPEGRPLVEFFDAAQPWKRVRSWLFDLADELRAGLDDGSLPTQLGFDRLWLTRDGRVVLLDFPAPGAPAAESRPIDDQNAAQAFLSALAEAALAPRTPLHAREFLQTLVARRFESMALVAGNLRAHLEKPAEVSPRRRLIGVAAPAMMALLVAMLFTGLLSFERRHFEAYWAHAQPGRVSPRQIVALLDSNPSPATIDHGYTVLAGRYRDLHQGHEFWRGSVPGGMGGLGNAQAMRQVIELARNARPNLSEEEIRRAEAAIQGDLEKLGRVEKAEWFLLPLAIGSAVLGCGALFGVIWAALFGAPPLLRLNDLAIVRADGRVASRFRVVLRGLLSASPLLVAAVAVAAAQNGPAERFLSAMMLALGALAVALIGSIWCVLRPERGPQDRLTGVWLAPR